MSKWKQFAGAVMMLAISGVAYGSMDQDRTDCNGQELARQHVLKVARALYWEQFLKDEPGYSSADPFAQYPYADDELIPRGKQFATIYEMKAVGFTLPPVVRYVEDLQRIGAAFYVYTFQRALPKAAPKQGVLGRFLGGVRTDYFDDVSPEEMFCN